MIIQSGETASPCGQERHCTSLLAAGWRCSSWLALSQPTRMFTGSCRLATAAAGCRLHTHTAVTLKHTEHGFIDSFIQTAGTCVTDGRACMEADRSGACGSIDCARGGRWSAVLPECGRSLMWWTVREERWMEETSSRCCCWANRLTG